MKFKALYIILTTLILLSLTTSAATINANSCERTDVLNAVNSANDGDTVLVPPGSCTWNSGIPLTKDTILMGSGKTQTIITWTGGLNGIFIFPGSTSRVTGFRFNMVGGADQVIEARSESFRIDNNIFDNQYTTNRAAIRTTGDNPNPHARGVIDNNEFFNARVVTYGDIAILHGVGASGEWAKPTALGTDNAVFIEDNEFTWTMNSNTMDSNYGGRFVFRYNNVQGSTSVDSHSMQGGGRASRSSEVYGNVLDANIPFFVCIWLRGGGGVIFDNVCKGQYSTLIAFDNVRSHETRGGSGRCDGTSPWDGNAAGEFGWICRDQPGAGPDQSLMTPSNPYPAQAAEPIYVWNNKDGAGDEIVPHTRNCGGGVNGNGACEHVKIGRDFIHAEHPSYTPFTHPHPLRTSGFLADNPSNPPGPPPPDTTPPVLSNGQPTGSLVSGTTSTTISLTTNEGATCKYSTTSGQTYSSMPNTFSTTGSTSHSTTVSGLSDGNSYNYYVRCEDTSNNENTADFTISFNVAAPDNTQPTVSITSPTNGATVSGSVTISASASDNVGVAGVQFQIDGTNQGSQDTTSPYSISWDTTSLANGSYTITSIARDLSNNIDSESIIVNVENAPLTIPSGLVAHWNLDEGTGSTAADASGNNNAGSINSATWTTGQSSGALDFDGQDDSINVGSSSNLDNMQAMTLAFWANPRGYGESNQAYFAEKGGWYNTGWWLQVSFAGAGNHLVFNSNYNGQDLSRTSDAFQESGFNSWNHYVVTWDGSPSATGVRMYRDGVEANYATGTDATGTRADDSGRPIIIGNSVGSSRTFDGAMDDIKIWNRVLTPTEIQALASGTPSPPPPNPPPPAQIPGDVNNDGVVNVLDLLFVVQEIGKQNFNPVTDVNSDSSVNILDLVWIVNRMNS